MDSKLSVTDAVYLCMRNGHYWTFWDLQRVIQEKTNTFYGEPTISAAIRNLRKEKYRQKYGLSLFGETIIKKRTTSQKGYQYKLTGEYYG